MVQREPYLRRYGGSWDSPSTGATLLGHLEYDGGPSYQSFECVVDWNLESASRTVQTQYCRGPFSEGQHSRLSEC
jgi:hypothetical protein